MAREKRALVSIAHTREKHRSPERVETLVRDALQHIGGMETFVAEGASVLIVPDVSVPRPSAEASNTDPLLVAALIRQAREAGAARVVVGAPSCGTLSGVDCMRATGLAEVAAREGAETADIALTDESTAQSGMPPALADASVIINAPKAKNHHAEPIACALENWARAIDPDWRSGDQPERQLSARFAEGFAALKPHLTVVDAIICGEGDGPVADMPRFNGTVLAGVDPVAVDATVCRMMGHDPAEHKLAAAVMGGAEGWADHVDTLGIRLEDVSFQAWRPHADANYLPVNLLVGKGVSVEGSVGYVRAALDGMLRRGDLAKVTAEQGTPTIMVGEIEDPSFEAHLAEGPYVVVDDAALERYRTDPRVKFVSGSPVTADAAQALADALGLTAPPAREEPAPVAAEDHGANGSQDGADSDESGDSDASPAARPAIAFAKPLAAVGVGALAIGAVIRAVRGRAA
jgi:uncharacterized protein (DUF362 family)